MAGMTPRLELRGLEKRFGETPAVRDLSMRLDQGEFVSLLGPSGCGKSTTLAMIAGFETPSAGEILIDGAVVNDLPPQKRRIGLVFQDYAVFSRMSVRANLGFGLEARRIPRRRRERQVAEMAEKLDLSGVLGHRGDRLNMSEMQRVALGRVLLTKPELVLLDEPMSNLDASLRASLRNELKQIQRELGQTVLYVTHDQVEAMSMSDRIAVMQAGAMLQLATPDAIYDRPVNRFVAEFIGDPPINLLPCDIVVTGGEAVANTPLHRGLPLGSGRVRPGPHLLAIRPHDVQPQREPGVGSAAAPVRFVENLGAEHVLHLEYGDTLLRTMAAPGFAGEGEVLHVSFPPHRLLLIDPQSEAVVALDRRDIAA